MRARFYCLVSGMLFILTLLPFAGSSQDLNDIEVTVGLSNEPLENCFRNIEKQTGLLFAFLPDQVDAHTSVTLPRGKRSVSTTLDIVLKGTPLAYRAMSGSIVIFRKPQEDVMNPASLKEDQFANMQLPMMITGKVTDATGEPMPDVNVLIKGAYTGTTTNDADGQYTLYAKADDILVFSFVGYKTVETSVNNRQVINLTLASENTMLEQVEINAGYWKVKEREQTGNISRLGGDDIQKQPVSNPLAALEGRMTGVYVQQITGVPGGAVNIRIRGTNSLRPDGNSPLYIIDGVPFTSSTLSSFSVSGQILPDANPLNNINPADIGSIEILKDADATAIYGSRGANGVVLITTKKARRGKTTADVSIYRGVGHVTRTMNLLDTRQWLQMRKQAFANDNAAITLNNAPDLLLWDTTRYTDWQQKLIGGTAQITNAQASLSGGDHLTQYFFSSGFYRETSVFPGDFAFNKGSAHFNFDHTSRNRKLNFVLTASYSITGNNQPGADFTPTALQLLPNAPALYNENGALNWANSTWINPLALVDQTYNATTDNTVTHARLSYKIFEGLQLRSSIGYTRMQVKEVRKNRISSFDPAITGATGSSLFGDSYINTWIAEPQAEYERSIRHVGKFQLHIGTTFQQTVNDAQTIEATGYTNDALLNNLMSAPSIELKSDRHAQYRYTALFGRINFDREGKYLVNITGRRDGSSRLGPGKQFANFGAIGAAWVFTNENFVYNRLPFLSYGKLRASYGTTGSDQIGDYQYLDAYAPTTFTYDGMKGAIPVRLANPNYSWETNHKAEAALEIGFLNDRLLLGASYYSNRSSNQLVGLSLPVITGQRSIQYNLPAVVSNSGLELTLNTVVTQKDFLWKTALNVTIPRNRLVRYPNLKASNYADQYVIGKPLSIQQKYHLLGVDPQLGNYTFEDVNTDNAIIPSDDYRALEEISQKLFGGFHNSIQFGRWQLDFLLQFVQQTGNNYLSIFRNIPGTRFGNQPALVMDSWQNAGDNSSIQRFTQRSGSDAAVAYSLLQNSDRVIADASFLRLKNISLSWQPYTQGMNMKRTNMPDMRIFVQGQNVFTFTGYQGYDPESLASRALPPLRVFTAGIQVKL